MFIFGEISLKKEIIFANEPSLNVNFHVAEGMFFLFQDMLEIGSMFVLFRKYADWLY